VGGAVEDEEPEPAVASALDEVNVFGVGVTVKVMVGVAASVRFIDAAVTSAVVNGWEVACTSSS
jgi:hypothetical protein